MKLETCRKAYKAHRLCFVLYFCVATLYSDRASVIEPNLIPEAEGRGLLGGEARAQPDLDLTVIELTNLFCLMLKRHIIME